MEIPLTRGYVALVDAEDYDFLMQWKWTSSTSRKGLVYAMRRPRGPDGKYRIQYMHRTLLSVDGFVDHKDGNTLNNVRSNLRMADKFENQQNRGPNRNNTSGFKGVTRHKLGWMARIGVNGTYKYIGKFATPEEAHCAYVEAALRLHGEFAKTE